MKKVLENICWCDISWEKEKWTLKPWTRVELSPSEPRRQLLCRRAAFRRQASESFFPRIVDRREFLLQLLFCACCTEMRIMIRYRKNNSQIFFHKYNQIIVDSLYFTFLKFLNFFTIWSTPIFFLHILILIYSIFYKHSFEKIRLRQLIPSKYYLLHIYFLYSLIVHRPV